MYLVSSPLSSCTEISAFVSVAVKCCIAVSICVSNNGFPKRSTLTKAEISVQEESGEDTKYIDADPFVRNFSYTVKDDKIYYREGAVMRECNPNAASAERIRKLVELRDTTRALIDAQLQDLPDEEIRRLQGLLNRQYDAFRAKHGLINSRSAELSFRDDSSYYLLCSLENVDEKGNFISKSDMFTKRTIRSAQIPDHADTASDALALSIGERAKVDMPYMMHLTGKDEATLAKELAGVIFVEPFRKQEDGSPVYLMADEYLSGNVREKLRIAHVAADQDPAFRINVEALEQVQPKDLTAGEITVRLGVTWIGPEIIKQFADELFQSTYREQKIAVRYNEYLNNWYISTRARATIISASRTPTAQNVSTAIICWRTHSTCGPPKFTIQSMTKTARSSINSMVLPPKKHRPSSG